MRSCSSLEDLVQSVGGKPFQHFDNLLIHKIVKSSVSLNVWYVENNKSWEVDGQNFGGSAILYLMLVQIIAESKSFLMLDTLQNAEPMIILPRV